ncbi:60S ribosomal protein L7-like 1 [Xenentodon cancila]
MKPQSNPSSSPFSHMGALGLSQGALVLSEGALGLSQGALGLSQGALGLPEGALGLPEGALGLPEGALGLPEGALGLSEGALGLSQGGLGLPEGALGLPEGALGLFAVFLVVSEVPWPYRMVSGDPICSHDPILWCLGIPSAAMALSSKKVIKLVPEYLLKKRKTYQAIKATQAKLALLEKRKVSRGRPLKFKRLEEFLKDSHTKHRDETRIRRSQHRPAAPLPPAENKLAFAVRIRMIKGVSPKVMKVVQMLRLRKIFSGAFVKINKSSMAMMKLVEPYVAWGFPNLKSVRELILKRGQTRIGKRQVPLTDNTFIEQHMGKHDIICLEDLIHEIYSVGKNFLVANNFLLPFKLSVPRHAAKDKVGLLKDLGNPGFRGRDINSIIRQLN